MSTRFPSLEAVPRPPNPAPGDAEAPAAGPSEISGSPDAPTPLSPGQVRFESCRWRHRSDGVEPDYCTHRDVLPLAGTTGFNPDAWCPDCAFYKLRRTVRR